MRSILRGPPRADWPKTSVSPISRSTWSAIGRRRDALDLTPKEFGLLSLLARRAGEVLSPR